MYGLPNNVSAFYCVPCAYWMPGSSPSPTPTPTYTEERGDYTLRAFGKNIWGKVSQKVVLTCDCVIAGCFDKAKGL